MKKHIINSYNQLPITSSCEVVLAEPPNKEKLKTIKKRFSDYTWRD